MAVQEHIVATLRQRIRAGDLPAGTRLPTVRELELEFGVSLLTIHRCLRTLADLGFIETRGRHGTVVVEHPPHRSRFGLVLPILPDESGTYLHLRWQALALAARTFNDPAQSIEIFHAVDHHRELAEHVRLRCALDDQRLAGLMVPQPLPTVSHPAIDVAIAPHWFNPRACGLPVIGLQNANTEPQFGNISLTQVTFIDRALDIIQARGLTRVAILLSAGAWLWNGVEHSRAACANRGLTCPRGWIHGLPENLPGWSAHLIDLLFSTEQPPEALIIGDDHLVPTALATLAELGRAPLVIGLANFPLRNPPPKNMLCLGWDHRAYLQLAITRITAYVTTGEALGDRHLPLISSGETA